MKPAALKLLPFIALILSHSIWGGNFVVAKITLQEFPPFTLAFLRFGLASLLLTPFLLAETKKIKIKPEHLPHLIAVGIFIITLNIAFFFAGITRTTAINASVLTLIIPMMAVLMGWIFLKEKIYRVNLFGIVLGLIGALVVIGLPQILSGDFSSEVIMGNILIILASIVFVVGAVISKKMLQKYPSLIVTTIAFLVGAVTFFLPALNEYLKDPLWPEQVTMLGLLGLVYMTLLSSISAYFLFEWGLAKVGVIKADLFQYIEPLIATTLAILILGEIISIEFIAGAILIAAGVYFGTLGKEVHHRRHKPHRI